MVANSFTNRGKYCEDIFESQTKKKQNSPELDKSIALLLTSLGYQ